MGSNWRNPRKKGGDHEGHDGFWRTLRWLSYDPGSAISAPKRVPPTLSRRCAVRLREITPPHLRCGFAQCPAVFEDGPEELVIIGKVVSGETAGCLSGRIGADECAIRISREMFAGLAANHPIEQTPRNSEHVRPRPWPLHRLAAARDFRRGLDPARKRISHGTKPQRYFELRRIFRLYWRAFDSCRGLFHAIFDQTSTR
jgi:hypothetical protein